MSLQSLERQLNAITQKLEAIHSDIKAKGTPASGGSPGAAAATTGSSVRAGRGMTSFAEEPASRPRRGDEAQETTQKPVMAPVPPPAREAAVSPEPHSRPGAVPRGSSFGSPKRGAAAEVIDEGRIGRGARGKDPNASESVSPDGGRSPLMGTLEKVDKKKSAADRQAKKDFFGPLEFNGSWSAIPKAAGVACVWLGCASLAVEFISGSPTSMEDIMNTNNMAIHMVTFPSVTLAELYDTIEEYISASGLRNSKGVNCETATCDSITVDEVGDEIGMGERLPVMTLAAFRKEVSRMDANSILIFNYDPYVVQEAEITKRDVDEDEDEPTDSPKKADPVQWGPKNQGQFAILLQFNPALHNVTIGTPHFGPDGKFRLELHTATVQTMYSACCVRDGYTNKSRGFVRVFTDRNAEPHVPSIFPLAVLDGREAGGLQSVALDVAIAPHILGLSMLHHLVQSTLLSDKARRRQSTKSVSDVQLRGIPVTKLCHVLGLPVSTIVGGSTKDSVPCAFAWYNIFLEKLGIAHDVSVGLVTLTRRGGAEDGAVNISDEQFLDDASLAVATKSVMLIGFDVNVALNVVVETRPEPCHFAIVVGVDEAHGVVRLADVNVKKYRKLWHVPITRLYNATIGYGYIVAAKSKETIEKLNCQKTCESVLSQGRYRLRAAPAFSRFEYPGKNYTITVLADALDRLGFPESNVESFVHNAGFHVSFLLSEHIPLQGAGRIASFYSHAKLYDEVSVTVTHYDDPTVQTLEYFTDTIRAACGRQDAVLVVNFQQLSIQSDKRVWNGGSGGPMAIVERYLEAANEVTLCDANPSAYYRTWTCSVKLLYNAVTQTDRISGRARGVILLEKKAQTAYDDTRGYDLRRAMIHHPFKPTVSPTASVMALAASEMMQKSYSPEQFIYNSLEFSLTKFLQAGADVAAITANTNHAFAKLGLQLVAVPMAFDSVAAFKVALEGTEGLLSVTIVLYDTAKVHHVKGLGTGAAVVNNKGEDGVVKLVDGNPTVFGDFWQAAIHDLLDATVGVLVVKSAQEEEMDS